MGGMSAAGYSLSLALTSANTYCLPRSRYSSNPKMDSTYSHIPASNVPNITQGRDKVI
jgi:hypothetical protein